MKMQMFTQVKGYATADNARKAAVKKGINLETTRHLIAACGINDERFIVVVGASDAMLIHTGVVAVFS